MKILTSIAYLIAFTAAAATSAFIATLCLFGLDHLFILAFYPIFIVALMHSFLLGLPVFIILSWRGWFCWPSTMIISFIIGALPLTVLGGHANLEDIIFLGLMGASGGIVFWLLWRYWIIHSSYDA